MSFNSVNSLILDTETFAIAVAEEMAGIEADKAELFARSKREAALAVATETAATVAAAIAAAASAVAIANAEADEAEKIAHEKREAANAAASALFASETMVESGFTGITVDDEEPTRVDARTAAGRTHASRAARKEERKAAMKVRYVKRARAAKNSKILQERIREQRDEEMRRAYAIQARARQAEIEMRVAVEIELRHRGFSGGGGGGGGGRGGGGTNAGVVACFMAGI